MRAALWIAMILILAPTISWAQGKRLWVLSAPGAEMVEYDLATLVPKQKVKLPAEALKNPAAISVNRIGQIMFVVPVSLPLPEEDWKSPHKIWIWDGHAASTVDLGVQHSVEERGSNQVITESAPAVFLSADGQHLFWFANQVRRLEREELDLSATVTWQAWQTDLAGHGREDLASETLPECRCKTGSCEETCPTDVVWTPETGIDSSFLLTQFVAGQTNPTYKASSRYQNTAGKWTGSALPEPLQRLLDSSSAEDLILEAIPDTGCCGWSNQSNDQTVLWTGGKKITVFDEQATYKNADYDVSFYTSNAKLSPSAVQVAMTVISTAQADKPIQMSEQGQANPAEAQQIRKALTGLPAVVVKSAEETPKQLATLPHATLVGWIDDKELLIIENHMLSVYNVKSGARRKSTVRVDDAARVFLR